MRWPVHDGSVRNREAVSICKQGFRALCQHSCGEAMAEEAAAKAAVGLAGMSWTWLMNIV